MILRVGHQHSWFWPILACFVDYYSLFWGPGVISRIYVPRGAFSCRSSALAVFVDSDPFRGLVLSVLGPRVFSMIDEPWVRLRVGHQNSPFWLILARFVDYYSLFWGPGVISKIDEPRGAFTCRSSTLAVLADFGLFCGLLLTVLGSRGDFQD